MALEHSGFTALVAKSGLEAVEILSRHSAEISVIILDLSMPGFSGQEILPKLTEIRPDLKVIVSSGYSEVETLRLFQGQRVSGFLQKPYRANQLVQKVKEALEA
jgi:DNA-binding NtrC family response regulator